MILQFFFVYGREQQGIQSGEDGKAASVTSGMWNGVLLFVASVAVGMC